MVRDRVKIRVGIRLRNKFRGHVKMTVPAQ